jgi:glycosyltransferase involved in cell wall biosynthesis
MTTILPISALVPTRNRSQVFQKTLESLALQSHQPIEMIVIDGSDDSSTQMVCEKNIANLSTKIHYHRAQKLGAAIQRNQAIAHASQETIWLLDDDILLEPDCLQRLWEALQSEPRMGGVNAMITNQKYSPPGRVSRALFEFLDGTKRESYAGKCIGPALNLLPEDREELPEIVPVEWLNTTCVLYKKSAVPNPLFPDHFTGYSLMEDVTLSLTVGKKWQLANARTARIYHDSQPGDHKNNERVLSQMDLVNRHFVMTKILGRCSFQDYFKLMVLQLFAIAALFGKNGNLKHLPAVVQGKILGTLEIFRNRNKKLAEDV